MEKTTTNQEATKMSAAARAKTAKERAAIAMKMMRVNRSGQMGRAFDDCFEMGDGNEVMEIIVDKCRKNTALTPIVAKFLSLPEELKAFMAEQEIARCRACGQVLSLMLSPYEKFEAQQKRLFAGYCSAICEGSR